MMKRSVQILLLCALLPQFAFAREETLEERKRRIMRKYMRTSATVAESNLLIPVEELPEDEQLFDSEKFKEPQVEFKRHEMDRTTMPRPVPARRALPETEGRNWLLSEEEMDEEDLYADPFSRAEEPETPKSRDYRRDDQLDSSRRYTPSYGWRKQEPAEPQTETYPRSSLFGTQPTESSASSFNLNYRSGTSAADDPLASPFSGATRPSDRYRVREDQETKQQGFIPYRSPYQSQQPSRTPPYSGFQQQQEQEEFQRVDPYQKWKDQRKTWDPTKDDAYLDELMQRNRR